MLNVVRGSEVFLLCCFVLIIIKYGSKRKRRIHDCAGTTATPQTVMLGTIRPPSALPEGPFLAFTTIKIKGLLSSEAPEKEEKDEVDGCDCQMLFGV